MSRSQIWINRVSFWVLYLWGQLYFIRDGGAYLLDGKVIGYSWYNYLRQAWLIERRISRHYNYFREPLYGGIIGEFGEHTGSYADVAILVSSISGSLSSLFLGLGVWSCFPRNGGFWGGFASLTMFLSAGLLPTGRWGNHYSLLILGMVLIFWSLLRAIHHRKHWGVVALTLGIACAIDQRVFPWIPIAMIFCTLSARSWARGSLYSLLMLITGLGVPRFFRWFFAEDPRHRLSIEEVMQFQREVVSRWSLGDVGNRTTACSSLPEVDYLRPAFFLTDCSWEIVVWNWSRKITAFSVVPLSWVWAGLGIIFLAALFHNSRNLWIKWLFLCSIIGMVLFWSALMPLPSRYLPSTCIGLGLIMPFLLAILDQRGPNFRFFLCVLASTSVLYLCYFGAGAAESRKEINRQIREQEEYWQIWQIVQRYQEQDSFLDCGEKGLNALILPQTYVARPFHQLKNSSACEEWIENEQGDWILVTLDSSFLARLAVLDNWKLYYQRKDLDFSLWKLERPR